MKKTLLLLLLASGIMSQAQTTGITPSVTSSLKAGKKSDRLVTFRWKDEGKKLPLQWGFDLAWEDESNLRRGINFAGVDLCDIVRVSFRPTESVESGVLGEDQAAHVKNRANIVKKWCKRDVVVNLNDDHASIHDYYKVKTGQSAAVVAQHWAKMMDLHKLSYENDYGLKVVSVSPINESDYDYHAHPSSNASTRKQVFNYVDQYLINDYKYHDQGIRLCGGNTLNDDKAYEWWNYLKANLDEGNTHQLAGDFAHYADFFKTVRAYGHHATNDELHNTMEAMVGVEYGMQTGIWWGTADYVRSQFMKASNKGVRLGYAEHRPNWTSAAVYRHNDGVVEAFVGSSERQAVSTTFGIACLDNPIWVDGAGPYYEYPLYIHGGDGYQKGQTNAETVVNVQHGEDIQPEIPLGDITLINKAKTVAGTSGTAIAGASSWYLWKVPETIMGDYSGYYFMRSKTDSVMMDLNGFGLNEGTRIIAYRGNRGDQEQWHLRYAGDGWFYIISRYSGMCIDGASTDGATKIITGADSQKWRFLPKGTKYETAGLNYAPTNLILTELPSAVRLDWTLAKTRSGALYYNYDVQRSTDGTNWHLIGRNVYGSTFVDNTARMDQKYFYRVAVRDIAFKVPLSKWLTSSASASASYKRAEILNLSLNDNTYDSTPNANHAAFSAKDTTFSSTYFHEGKSLLLNNGKYLALSSGVSQSRELTFSAWVRIQNSTNWQRLFDFGNGENQYFFLTPRADDGYMRLAIKNGGTEYKLTSTTSITTGSWTHVAVTVSDKEVALYKNGVKVASTTSWPIRPCELNSMMNYIGRSQFASDPAIAAYVDDIRMFNYSLSASQVASLYAGERFKGDVNADGVVSLEDVAAMERAILGKDTEGLDLNAADINGDGVVSVDDQTLLIDSLK